MDNQARDLKLEKDKTSLSQTRKEKSAKRELENARKKASSWRKQNLRIACENFICLSFLNLKVDINFVTLSKLNFSVEWNSDLHRSK